MRPLQTGWIRYACAYNERLAGPGVLDDVRATWD